MLEYTKTVVQKVWFSDHLFEKEYAKAKTRLTESEMEELDEFIETFKQ